MKKETKAKIYELLRYIIIGFATTFINWGCSILLRELTGMPAWLNSVISWIVSVVFFAFWAYKFFVFRSRSMEKKMLLSEFVGFTSARLLTLGVETLFMYVFVDALGFNQVIHFGFTRLVDDQPTGSFGFGIREFYIFKFLATVIITILNYIFSKFIVFKKGQKLEREKEQAAAQSAPDADLPDNN